MKRRIAVVARTEAATHSNDICHIVCAFCHPDGDGPRFCGTPNDDPGWCADDDIPRCVVCLDIARCVGCPECGP